jgi:hypothetical protein
VGRALVVYQIGAATRTRLVAGAGATGIAAATVLSAFAGTAFKPGTQTAPKRDLGPILLRPSDENGDQYVLVPDAR